MAGVLIYIAALNLAESYPSVPIQCTVLMGPLLTTVVRALTRPVQKDPMVAALQGVDRMSKMGSMRLMKMQVYVGSEKDATAFYAGSMTAFMLLGLATIIVWVVWALSNNIDFGNVTFGDAASELTYIRWISPVAVGLAYLMFGLIVSLRVGLASSYDHGDMLMKMVKEADQERTKTGRLSIQRKTLVGMVAQQLETDDLNCRNAFEKLSPSQKDWYHLDGVSTRCFQQPPLGPGARLSGSFRPELLLVRHGGVPTPECSDDGVVPEASAVSPVSGPDSK